MVLFLGCPRACLKNLSASVSLPALVLGVDLALNQPCVDGGLLSIELACQYLSLEFPLYVPYPQHVVGVLS